jgi:hypothetical protein
MRVTLQLDMDILQFEATYPPQPPRRAPSNESELRRLSKEDGVFVVLGPPPDTDVRIKPKRRDHGREGRHLWVLVASAIPCILESAPNVAPPLESGVAKHTNLTGGDPASCGGELWVDPIEEDKLYVNGASGRYGPLTSQQLDDAVSVFEGLGFRAVSFGWDDDVNLPARVLR